MDFQEPMDNIVELVDEDGETVRFEHLMTLPYENEEYVVLTNAEATPDSDEGEVFILRIAQDDQGEDCYVTLDSEEVEQAVFDHFMKNVEEMEENDSESE